jgi:hypothetical protein
MNVFCFVRFVHAQYFRDNDNQISELTNNKYLQLYRSVQIMNIASFSTLLVASFRITTEGKDGGNKYE